MKILVINNSAIVEKEDGGLYIHNSCASFLEELASLNEVLFFQHKIKPETIDQFKDYCINGRNFKVKALRRGKFKTLAYIQAYLHGIYLIAKYDALYLFYPNSFKFLGFFAKLFGKKLGLYLRGQNGIESSVSQKLYRKADIVLTVSPGFTEIVKELGGNADTIRPMITISETDIVTDREYKPKDEYRVIFLGRIEFDKGLRELIQAVRLLKDHGIKNFNLDIVGDGSHMAYLKQLCSNLDVDNMVTFWGNQSSKEKIKRFFIQADIFILPTYHEGFPRTLYEAMAFGTPIITTFVGGIPYIMRNKENCLEIQPKSVESIYKVLRSVMEDYGQVGPIACNASQTLSNYFNTHSLSHAAQLTQHLNKAN